MVRVLFLRHKYPEIEEVGFSLDSIPGLRSTFRHFAVSPPRFGPRPRGSIHLAEKPPTVPSNRGSALIWGSRFSVPAALGPRRAPKSPTPRPVYFANLGCVSTRPGRTDCTFAPPDRFSSSRNRQQCPPIGDRPSSEKPRGPSPSARSPRPLGISGYWTPSI